MNELEIDTIFGKKLYLELIQINYKLKEAKLDLAKCLNIDFEKLELYEIQNLIEEELKKQNISLNDVKYEINYYDLYHISFNFKIDNLSIRMHNPFKIDNIATLNYEQIENSFKEQFGNVEEFLKSLSGSISTNNFRIINYKRHEQTDVMTKTLLMETKQNEYKISISNFSGFLNKNYIKSKMKNAWL